MYLKSQRPNLYIALFWTATVFNNYLNKVLMVLSGIAVLSLMILATANVVLRIFQIPFRGTYEIVSFLGAIVIALPLGYAQKRKDNIVVDILTKKFPKRVQRVIGILTDHVIMVFFGIVAWQVFVLGTRILKSGEVSESLKIIFHPFVYAVSLGFIVLSFTAFIEILTKLFREGE